MRNFPVSKLLADQYLGTMRRSNSPVASAMPLTSSCPLIFLPDQYLGTMRRSNSPVASAMPLTSSCPKTAPPFRIVQKNPFHYDIHS
jgi:hypothetical protein